MVSRLAALARRPPSRCHTGGVSYPFLKGHGTENDFVLLPDPDGTVHGDLDRRPGPRAVRPPRRHRRRRRAAGGAHRRATTRAVAARDEAAWFMDYRNADGSVTEMCGNGDPGLRAATSSTSGSADACPMPIATRDGVKVLDRRRRRDHRRHGRARGARRDRGRRSGAPVVAARHVDMGNPHAVAFVDDLADAGDAARGARRTTPRSTPTASTSSSSYAAASTTSRCGCTSAARARPGPAAPAPAR